MSLMSWNLRDPQLHQLLKGLIFQLFQIWKNYLASHWFIRRFSEHLLALYHWFNKHAAGLVYIDSFEILNCLLEGRPRQSVSKPFLSDVLVRSEESFNSSGLSCSEHLRHSPITAFLIWSRTGRLSSISAYTAFLFVFVEYFWFREASNFDVTKFLSCACGT